MLKTQTVGLVHLSEFKEHRVELGEQRDREAAEKLQPTRSGDGGGGLASSSREGSEAPTGSAGKRTKKRKKVVKGKLSFAGEERDGDDGTDDGSYSSSADPTRSTHLSCQEYLHQPIFCWSSHRIFGSRRYSWQRRVSNCEDNNKSGEEDEVTKRKVNPKPVLPAAKALTKNTLLREA